MFVEYSKASQNLAVFFLAQPFETSGESAASSLDPSIKGDFDDIRTRFGIGYAVEVSPEFLA